jgi:hypothetical protein
MVEIAITEAKVLGGASICAQVGIWLSLHNIRYAIISSIHGFLVVMQGEGNLGAFSP